MKKSIPKGLPFLVKTLIMTDDVPNVLFGARKKNFGGIP